MTKEQLMNSIWDIYTRCQEAGMETVFYEDSGIDDDMNLEAYSERELDQIYRDLVSKGYEDEDLYIDYENGVDWEPGRYHNKLTERFEFEVAEEGDDYPKIFNRGTAAYSYAVKEIIRAAKQDNILKTLDVYQFHYDADGVGGDEPYDYYKVTPEDVVEDFPDNPNIKYIKDLLKEKNESLNESVSTSYLESLIDELEDTIQSAIQTAEQLANAFGGRVKANMERYMIPQLETILEGGPAAGGMDAIPDLKDDVLDGDVADWSRDIDESVQDPRKKETKLKESLNTVNSAKKDTNVETKSVLGENMSTQRMPRRINIREALNKIDYTTYNKYDLLNMYEALTLTESDKKDLVHLIEKKNFYAINTFLSKKLSKRG